MCLVEFFSDHLQTSDLQFGFKKQLGCANAIYALSSVIEYFTKNGSTINACFLDVSKAFDKVNHTLSLPEINKERDTINATQCDY